MRGVILAGGEGTRLYPKTAATNKHLVGVGDVPMIEYPLYTLIKSGIDVFNIVTGGEHFQSISKYLSKTHPGLKLAYHSQLEAGGIAQALSLVENFNGDGGRAVILGDNIFAESFEEHFKRFEELGKGAMIFVKEVENPERFGVAEIQNGKILSIEEKPKNPKSNLAVTGLYLYDSSVFDKIRKLKPSDRGELEITDVNKMYLEEGTLDYVIVNKFWSDAGTHESLRVAEEFVRESELEEIIKDRLPRNL